MKENKFLFPILDLQGWALVASGDPWHLAFPLGQLEGFFFHEKHTQGTLDFTISEHWAPFNFFKRAKIR